MTKKAEKSTRLVTQYSLILMGASLFSALVFSIISLTSNNISIRIVSRVLGLICALSFGFVSYTLVYTSSPQHDVFYYYLGLISFLCNATAFIMIILSIIKKV